MFTKKKEKIHFVGIGGIGMSAIASVLNAMGYAITGSDLSKTEKTKSLEKSGIKIFYGHKASNIKDDIIAVVTSSAISPTNEEIIEAKEKKDYGYIKRRDACRTHAFKIWNSNFRLSWKNYYNIFNKSNNGLRGFKSHLYNRRKSF